MGCRVQMGKQTHTRSPLCMWGKGGASRSQRSPFENLLHFVQLLVDQHCKECEQKYS